MVQLQWMTKVTCEMIGKKARLFSECPRNLVFLLSSSFLLFVALQFTKIFWDETCTHSFRLLNQLSHWFQLSLSCTRMKNFHQLYRCGMLCTQIKINIGPSLSYYANPQPETHYHGNMVYNQFTHLWIWVLILADLFVWVFISQVTGRDSPCRINQQHIRHHSYYNLVF